MMLSFTGLANWLPTSIYWWLNMTSRRLWNDTRETEALLGGIQHEQEGSYLWACSGQCPVWEESSWLLSWVIANFSAAAMGQPERLFQKKKRWRMWVSVTMRSALAQTHSTLGVQQMLSHINSSLSTIVIQKIPKGLQTQCLHLFPSSISEVTTSEYIFLKKKINMLCNGENTKKKICETRSFKTQSVHPHG